VGSVQHVFHHVVIKIRQYVLIRYKECITQYLQVLTLNQIAVYESVANVPTNMENQICELDQTINWYKLFETIMF
jgi:hypothetical protein